MRMRIWMIGSGQEHHQQTRQQLKELLALQINPNQQHQSPNHPTSPTTSNKRKKEKEKEKERENWMYIC